jgi:hypothetical protein
MHVKLLAKVGLGRNSATPCRMFCLEGPTLRCPFSLPPLLNILSLLQQELLLSSHNHNEES